MPTNTYNYPGYYSNVAKPQPLQTMVTSSQPSQPSPTLNAYMINTPQLISAPISNGSVTTDSSASSFSSISLNTQAPSHTFNVATPPAVMSPSFQPLMHNVVCSPGPVVYDPRALQSAWAVPPNMPQWQPIWVPQQPMMTQAQPFPVQNTEAVQQTPFFVEKEEKCQPAVPPQTRKNSRPRCKACAGKTCRNNSPKQVSREDILEATKFRPELIRQLPEFFGEPQLNFEEYVHYAPLFRTKSLDPEMQYFKIPRTTKERELNIPRRLGELFVRTFGPEDAPDSKDFDRISPHNHLCDARMAIRSSVVKALPNVIVGCRNMDEANYIFDTIFRFAGVSMVKSICNNLPQVFTAVVEIKDADNEISFECTGVVSLFNYHLFRRRIPTIVS